MKDVCCLVLVSGRDEYIPEHVDKEMLAKRLAAAMGPLAGYKILSLANHEASDCVELLTSQVVEFLMSITHRPHSGQSPS